MTQRDRTVLMVLGIVGLVAAFWFAALKPKNEDAKALDGEISAARQRLQAATATVAAAEKARAGYDEDYKQVALLGKAVPITRMRGQWKTLEIGGWSGPVLPTLHPAFLLRTPGAKAQAWKDMLSLKSAMTREGLV